MCVAELNVSVLPCRHRWYHLSRSCSPSTNLSNCGRKLALTGWEIKCDFCPFCARWGVSSVEYRIVGSDRPAASVETPYYYYHHQTPATLNTVRHEQRAGSLSRNHPNTLMAQEKNRAMNARMDAYVKGSIDAVLLPAPYSSPLPEADDDDYLSTMGSMAPSDASSDGYDSVRHASTSSASSSERSSIVKKMKHKSKRMSMASLFR